VVLVNPATQKKEERQRNPLGIWIATLAWQPV
jgi:type IV secretory pathway TrbF-like protein